MRQNVIIIGNGPATHVAAIYAATSNLNPLVILQPSNYPITGLDTIPGIPQEISATDYLALLKKQAERFNVTFVESSVTDIHCDSIIKVSTIDKTYITKTVILDDINLCKEMLAANMFQDGKVICEDNSSQCAIQGVYVCGSAREKYDDAIVLCGSGCMAALDAKEYIESAF